MSVLMLGASARAAQPDPLAVIQAGARTQGGLVTGSRLVPVTSLADSGPGTLRAALEQSGPRVVIFDVAGIIGLESDLRIADPFVTVAGQSAPAPGILLRGAKLRISAHDVVIQHIAVRPGRHDPVPDNADAISIGPCDSCDLPAHDIRLENISAGWAIDENIGLWGGQLTGITVRNSLISEALSNAGHEKGEHSMGILVGDNVQGVELVGNLFTSNNNRNPVIGPGASAYVANNYIYNPGRNAIHLYRGEGTRATIVGNVIRRGPNTRSRMVALDWQGDFAANYPNAGIFAHGNYCCDGTTTGDRDRTAKEARFSPVPLVKSVSWRELTASSVWPWVRRYAGARPAERHPIDARIVEGVISGRGHIIDDPAEVGGYAQTGAVGDATPHPAEPFAPSGLPHMTRIAAWLCLRHLQLGGPRTPECDESLKDLQAVLTSPD